VKVKELIERLHQFDGDLPVILASDEEGNNFDDLYSVEMSAHVKHPWGGIDVIHPDDIVGDEPLAVVLWP
jgi:hypothetical protein